MIEGKVSVLDRADVDTDQIIPKQFLKRVERTGFGEFLFYDWIRDGEIELRAEPDPGHRPQLRLRLLARARRLGAAGLRLRGDRRALVRRHLLRQLHQDRAAAGDPRRGALPRRSPRPARRGSTSTTRPSTCAGGVSGSRSTRSQAPPARTASTTSAITLAERGGDRRLRGRRRRRPRPGDDGAVSEAADAGRPRLGRGDLRPRLRPAGGVGAARSLDRLDAATATRPCSTPAAAAAGSPRLLLERLPAGQGDRASTARRR